MSHLHGNTAVGIFIYNLWEIPNLEFFWNPYGLFEYDWLMDNVQYSPFINNVVQYSLIIMMLDINQVTTKKKLFGWALVNMMTSSNGDIFRVTGHLYGELTGLWGIPRTKASDAKLWCFLWSAPE